jgi:hypothetical protein
MNKDINGLSRKELLELASNLLNEREFRLNHINKVSVCDVEVESNVESLESCKSAVNDLIKKNKNFITLRKNKVKADELGYFG